MIVEMGVRLSFELFHPARIMKPTRIAQVDLAAGFQSESVLRGHFIALNNPTISPSLSLEPYTS